VKAALKKLRDGARHLDWVASVLGVALIVAAVAMVYVRPRSESPGWRSWRPDS